MLKLNIRIRIVEKYMKWITDYNLHHTPETFLEFLLINHYIDERKVEKDNGQLYYLDTDSVKETE